MITDDDIYLIHEAMVVAQQGEGAVNPNPLVGALIGRDDDDLFARIIGNY